MLVFSSETAAMLGTESVFVCGAVKTERKRFKISLMQLDGTNVLGVSKYSK